MIDKRLIDYSKEYADYKETLKEEGRSFTLDDVMTVLEGFLVEHNQEMIDHRDRAAVIQLKQAHNTYADV